MAADPKTVSGISEKDLVKMDSATRLILRTAISSRTSSWSQTLYSWIQIAQALAEKSRLLQLAKWHTCSLKSYVYNSSKLARIGSCPAVAGTSSICADGFTERS
jgi:hypothetical protein